MTEQQEHNKAKWTIPQAERFQLYDAFLSLLAKRHTVKAISLFEEMPPDPLYAEMLREKFGDEWADAFYDGHKPYNLHATKITGILSRLKDRRALTQDNAGLKRAYELCLTIYTDIVKMVGVEGISKDATESLKDTVEMEAFCAIADLYLGDTEGEVFH